jgi:hypothetical protein
MYKEKYLKYKAKYLELNKIYKKQLGGAPEFTNIETDSFTYRCMPNISNLRTYEERLANVRLCVDTNKIGLYFANKAIISLAMCIEYNMLMEVGVFKVIKNIDHVIKGKYTYRYINPERYFEPNGELIPYVKPLPEENVSHIGCNLNLLDNNKQFLLPGHIQMGLNCLGSCELFLSTLIPEHLQSIELVEAYRFNPDIIKTPNDLHHYMVQNHYPFALKKYIDDKILIRFI